MAAGDEIIERIRKLLRLSRSPNQHEAQLALQRALELAREHAIEIEGLNPDEQAREKKITHEDTLPTARMTYDQQYAWAICQTFFNVTVIRSRCIRMVRGWPVNGVRVIIVGAEADICIARYVFGFITKQFSHFWRHHRGRLRNRHAYVHGMYLGIVAALLEKRPVAAFAEKEALVVKERDTYITSEFGNLSSYSLSKPGSSAHAATVAGYQRGLQTNIDMPLHAAADEPLALQ